MNLISTGYIYVLGKIRDLNICNIFILLLAKSSVAGTKRKREDSSVSGSDGTYV